MAMSDELIIGRKRIMDFYGIKSWRTIQNWEKKNISMIRHMPTGKPFILSFEAIRFLVAYDSLGRKEQKGTK